MPGARTDRVVLRASGLIAGLVAAVGLAIASAAADNDFGVPAAPAESRSKALAYGIALLLVGVHIVATSFGRAHATGTGPIVLAVVRVETARRAVRERVGDRCTRTAFESPPRSRRTA